MTRPVLKVSIDFSSGAGTGTTFIIGDPIYGQLDYNVLNESTSLIVDVSDLALQIKTNRTRNFTQDMYESGSAIVRLLDNNGDFNPENPSSPYAADLLPLRKISVSAVYGGTTYPLYFGYTTSYAYTYPKGQEVGYVDITCADAFRLYNNASLTTVTSATAGQTTGTRTDKILDQLEWPSSMRLIDTGDTTCIVDPGTSRTGLTALRDVEATELGGFYVSPEGDAVFKSRSSLLSSLSAAPTVFNQTGTGINYWGITFAFDDKLIINNANYSRLGGTVQSAKDQTSIDTYFTHSVTKENLLMETDAVALQAAQQLVASRKDTSIRIDSITLDLDTPDYSSGIVAALSLDYFDNMQITNIQPGGSDITKTLQCQGVSHDITPGNWRTTFATMEPVIDGFILDSSLYGIIGTSVLSY